jgi:hypothetical protein
MTVRMSGQPDHEMRISLGRAIIVADLNPLPREGEKLLIAITRGRQKLFLANIAGEYWLQCDSCERKHWKLVFGVSGVEGADGQ